MYNKIYSRGLSHHKYLVSAGHYKNFGKEKMSSTSWSEKKYWPGIIKKRTTENGKRQVVYHSLPTLGNSTKTQHNIFKSRKSFLEGPVRLAKQLK